MDYCKFCKAEVQKAGCCAHCGTIAYNTKATFIYGKTEGDSHLCEVWLTEKYLIVRSASKAETVGQSAATAAFGLLGALAASAINSAGQIDFGFYDLQELEKVIFPYHTGSLKKDTAARFVNKDGTDYVLNLNQNGMFSASGARSFIEALIKTGVFVENGGDAKYPVCCVNPLVNRETFALRMSRADTSFAGAAVTPSADAASRTRTEPAQPVYQAPVQPAPAVSASDWQTAWQMGTAPTEEKKEKKMCSTCGWMNSDGARFCSRCGTPFASTQQPEHSANDWKSKW